MSENPVIATCPRCGSPLAAGAVDGLCARCLGALNFDTLTDIDATGSLKPAPPPSPEELAPFFPQLEIHSCLGRGGMGVVYKARQKSLGRWVALKLLAPERAADPAFAKRFAREARTLASLNHPHIVAIHDFGEAGGYFHLIMEFVDGVNLRQLLKSKRLSPGEALAIIPPVCDALQSAHERGIVHRDIKPENLLIDRSGAVKIADFGIARMLDETEPPTSDAHGGPPRSDAQTLAAGTPDYAAPEQHSHAHADHRADIYSLGVVLYEMLTGERPDPKAVLAPSRRAKLDLRIDEIVLKAIAADPDRRFFTADEFRTVIEREKERLETPVRRPTRAPRVALLAVLLLVLALSGYVLWRPFETGPSVRQAAVSNPPMTLESALRQFEENFNALLNARKAILMQSKDGKAPQDLTREVARLEARDRELRVLLDRLAGEAKTR